MDVRWFDALPSTQELAHQLAGQGAAHGTAVAARVQTEGRGRRGRSWTSPRGGLWLSVLCRPPQDPLIEVVSLRVALAVANSLEASLPGLHLGIKWPNDLVLGTRKVGGILCEARWLGTELGWIVVGVGLNVTNPIPPDLLSGATNLAAAAPSASPEGLAASVAGAVATAASRGGALDPDELLSYTRRDILRGRRLREPAVGVAAGVGPDGALLVSQAAGPPLEIRSGTVLFAEA